MTVFFLFLIVGRTQNSKLKVIILGLIFAFFDSPNLLEFSLFMMLMLSVSLWTVLVKFHLERIVLACVLHFYFFFYILVTFVSTDIELS